MSGLVLENQTLVALDSLEHGRLLDGPGADVRPFLLSRFVVFLRVRDLPSRVPVVGELFEERGLDAGGLLRLWSAMFQRSQTTDSPAGGVAQLFATLAQ